MKSQINAELKKLLVREILNDCFTRQHYFGRILHQFGFDQSGTLQVVLSDHYRGSRRTFNRRGWNSQ